VMGDCNIRPRPRAMALPPQYHLRDARACHSEDRSIIKKTYSTDSGSSLAASVDSRQMFVKQADSSKTDSMKDTDMLNDALFLVSVATMARSEADKGPAMASNGMERTLSVDAKESSPRNHAKTPPPLDVTDCTAVTPSFSAMFVNEVILNENQGEEDEIKEARTKLSQVSAKSTANAGPSLTDLQKTVSSDQDEPTALPRHPLTFPQDESNNHRRPMDDIEGGSAHSHDSDPHHRYAHHPQERYHHPYRHPVPPRYHDMNHDRYPMHRVPHYEEERRFHHRYPPQPQPMHPYHPMYAKDDHPQFHPGAPFNHQPVYHGMPPQHLLDRRGVDRPELHEMPSDHVAREDFRSPSYYKRATQPPRQGQAHHSNGRIILKRKCAWKNYPELEQFLVDNREEYLRHSAMNYTSEQKQYNNALTHRLLEVAEKSNYEFDPNDFSFVAIRDRIRCYYKSFVQNCKKRGLTVGYDSKGNKRPKIDDNGTDTKDGSERTIQDVSNKTIADDRSDHQLDKRDHDNNADPSIETEGGRDTGEETS